MSWVTAPSGLSAAARFDGSVAALVAGAGYLRQPAVLPRPPAADGG